MVSVSLSINDNESRTTLRCLGADFKAGDEIILTRMDHEGNVLLWLQLAEDLDLVIKWLPVNLETWRVEPDALATALTDRTKLLAINHASNLTGSINAFSTYEDILAKRLIDGLRDQNSVTL